MREGGGTAGKARTQEGLVLEMQPNADAPLLRDDTARNKWLQQELTKCCEVREIFLEQNMLFPNNL